MRKESLPTKPVYSLGSVDNALRLLQHLRDIGPLRLKDAASELGVAPSTAHRILSMLTYRGFAVQNVQKMYEAGPSLGVPPVGLNFVSRLRGVVQPHLEVLAARSQETVSLTMRVGTSSRFLSTAEGGAPLHIADRQGTVLPAHLTSGGKVLLAELSEDMLRELFQPDGAESGPGKPLSSEDFAALQHELAVIRRNGYAANVEGTEHGVSAVGVSLFGLAALSIATPSKRFTHAMKHGLLTALRRTQHEAEVDMRADKILQSRILS